MFRLYFDYLQPYLHCWFVPVHSWTTGLAARLTPPGVFATGRCRRFVRTIEAE